VTPPECFPYEHLVYLELVALDAEKAFDTVNHEIMLNKLFHDDIDGDMWTLLRNVFTQ
jgi:hypothetical protein